jgi:hypothetical protein
MSRITALFVGIAALTVVSTVAEAADGCGRGVVLQRATVRAAGRARLRIRA